jgi:uncharacterized RDD family membrane protein YckC
MSEPDVRYAGFWIRFSAFLLDFFLLGLPIVIIFMLIFGADSWANASYWSFEILLQDLTYLIITLYLWVNWNGQTPGKRLLGIKIVTFSEYKTLNYTKALVRYIGYFIVGLTLGLGFLVIGLRNDKKGLHDLMADTCVVHEK